MKLLIYSDTGGLGGAEQINHLIACALAERGIEIGFAQPTAAPDLVRVRLALGIKPFRLRADVRFGVATIVAERDPREAHAVLDQFDPDVVLFADGTPFSNLAAKEVSAMAAIPYACLVHLVDPRWATRFAAHLPQLAAIYAEARAVVAVSQHNLMLLRSLFGLAKDQGEVILNARPDRFFGPPDPSAHEALRRTLGLADQALVCLTLARVELDKGPQYLLEAARLLQGHPAVGAMHFVWAGEGTRRAHLSALARMLGLEEQVRFLGARTDILPLLDGADLFLLPSAVEGMPLAVIEAMARGLPVLATAAGGTAEAMGDTGVLLPDPLQDRPALLGALAASLRRLSGDPYLRRALGTGARERAERLFRVSRLAADYQRLVHRIVPDQG